MGRLDRSLPAPKATRAQVKMGYPLVNDKGELERQTRTNTFIESTFQLDNMLAMAFRVGELLLVIECKRSRFQPGKVFASE